MNLEKYDIEALDEIYKTSDSLYNKSEELEILGVAMKSKLGIAEEEFSTNNYKRVQEATDNYLHKMKLMREELIELSKSCRELAEKIANIWQ